MHHYLQTTLSNIKASVARECTYFQTRAVAIRSMASRSTEQTTITANGGMAGLLWYSASITCANTNISNYCSLLHTPNNSETLFVLLFTVYIRMLFSLSTATTAVSHNERDFLVLSKCLSLLCVYIWSDKKQIKINWEISFILNHLMCVLLNNDKNW